MQAEDGGLPGCLIVDIARQNLARNKRVCWMTLRCKVVKSDPEETKVQFHPCAVRQVLGKFVSSMSFGGFGMKEYKYTDN